MADNVKRVAIKMTAARCKGRVLPAFVLPAFLPAVFTGYPGH